MDDDPKSRRSLADDPNFLASLSELDHGLGIDEDAGGPKREPPPRPRRPAPAAVAEPPRPAPPRSQTAPRSAAAPQRATASPPQRPVSVPRPQPPRPAPVAPFRPSVPSEPLPPGGLPARRPLIALFPPAPLELERPPDPLLGTSPGPQLRVGRHLAVAPAPPQEPAAYETFYGLNERPFSLSRDPKFLYHSASHDRGVQKLLDAIRRRDSAVVTGEFGIGKTTVCLAVVNEIDRRTPASLVSDPHVSLEDLLETVIVDFGAISREDFARGHLAHATRQELVDSLRSFVESSAARQTSAVLIIDDAQNVPPDALDQIRALAEVDGASVLQLVLAGPPTLLATLERPELKPLAERLTVRWELSPLQADEIGGYVMHRLAVAGTSPRVEFNEGALKQVYGASGGLPGLVNLICDRALTLGRDRSASVIDEALVETAAGELGITSDEGEAPGLLRFVAAVTAFVALMLVGAAAAAWVFDDQLARVVTQWQAIPPTPGGPIPRLPVPLAPIPLPD